ncbi:hypothetical protein JTB14_033769 [Gonioctena quinquepunctata]|nr:hypothetical protein JTB14_017493 [Gonioctena quinquepunctata]KAG5879096.1 hypothetical protein JTB14_033769 [Gonioctena quinquepunctata]
MNLLQRSLRSKSIRFKRPIQVESFDQYDEAQLFTKVHLKGATPSDTISSFRASGIYRFNKITHHQEHRSTRHIQSIVGKYFAQRCAPYKPRELSEENEHTFAKPSRFEQSLKINWKIQRALHWPMYRVCGHSSKHKNYPERNQA